MPRCRNHFDLKSCQVKYITVFCIHISIIRLRIAKHCRYIFLNVVHGSFFFLACIHRNTKGICHHPCMMCVIIMSMCQQYCLQFQPALFDAADQVCTVSTRINDHHLFCICVYDKVTVCSDITNIIFFNS